jgi:hypothetical protein
LDKFIFPARDSTESIRFAAKNPPDHVSKENKINN